MENKKMIKLEIHKIYLIFLEELIQNRFYKIL